MGSKNAAVAALRWSRHCLGAVRSLSPAAMIVLTLAFLIGGAGLADAATGGNFILGKANSESSAASLSSSAGTPLALSAPPGKAPLAVNRNVPSGDTGGFCYITKSSNPNKGISTGGGGQIGFMQAAETTATYRAWMSGRG
jgi:hypothetical protein